MRIKSIAGGLAVLAFSATAYAASFGQGVLGDVTIDSGANFARIAVGTTAIGGRPACHNASYNVHYGFDISTTKGKALLTAAQSALLAGRNVSVTGTGACVNVGSVTLENISALTVWK